jgi:hypothetical protein
MGKYSSISGSTLIPSLTSGWGDTFGSDVDEGISGLLVDFVFLAIPFPNATELAHQI